MDVQRKRLPGLIEPIKCVEYNPSTPRDSAQNCCRYLTSNTSPFFTSLRQASLRDSPARRTGDRLAPNLGPKHVPLAIATTPTSHSGFAPSPPSVTSTTTKGGHLILWDAKLILEFPPGTTILIPSAAIYHSNIPVAPGEHRFSFTQYTAGGIFAGEDSYWSSLSAAQRMAEVQKMAGRWEDGVNHYAYEEELMD
ncbi:hypothetical protein B0H14DRAFT_2650629 [Mycena olivaceomarginata]|nr:hypothetical protein B0H14DRAFT_2650629 [Mycena olivaceomarginata]